MDRIKQRFAKSFDTYDENALVQCLMAEKLCTALTQIQSEFDTVLEIGVGTGLFTRELANKIRFKKYIANDLCEESEQYVTPFVDQFIPGDACNIEVDADLMVSNAVMQWIDDWGALPKADMLAFSTFLPGNLHELQELTGLSLDYKSVEEVKQILGEILYWEEFEFKMTFATPMELLAHLKYTGVNSLGSWSFMQVKDFCRRCSTPELTYKPVIVVARQG